MGLEQGIQQRGVLEEEKVGSHLRCPPHLLMAKIMNQSSTSIWWSAVLRGRGAEAGGKEAQAKGGRRRQLEERGEVGDHLGLDFLLRESRGLMMGDSNRYFYCT